MGRMANDIEEIDEITERVGSLRKRIADLVSQNDTLLQLLREREARIAELEARVACKHYYKDTPVVYGSKAILRLNNGTYVIGECAECDYATMHWRVGDVFISDNMVGGVCPIPGNEVACKPCWEEEPW